MCWEARSIYMMFFFNLKRFVGPFIFGGSDYSLDPAVNATRRNQNQLLFLQLFWDGERRQINEAFDEAADKDIC
jgi:hypothetical protein